MFHELPHEIQEMIVRKTDRKTVEKHRPELRLLSKTFARALDNSKWQTSTSAYVITKGILQECTETIRRVFRSDAPAEEREAPMRTATYTAMYSKVYDVCTCKYPHNLTSQMYDQLAKQLERFMRQLEPEERRILSRIVGHCFVYLDRFYVKRLSLPTVAEMCAKYQVAEN